MLHKEKKSEGYREENEDLAAMVIRVTIMIAVTLSLIIPSVLKLPLALLCCTFIEKLLVQHHQPFGIRIFDRPKFRNVFPTTVGK